MPRTVTDALADLRDRIDESFDPAQVRKPYWSDVSLRRYLNEGANDVARRSETLLASKDVNVIQGTQRYLAPDDAVRIHRAEWRPTGQTMVYALEYKDYAGMDAVWWASQEVTQGYPAYFTMWGFPPSLTLILYPVPSSAGKVKLYYYRLPVAIVLDGTQDNAYIDVPEGWSDLVLDYAEAKALRKDGDGRWQEAKSLYEQKLTDMIAMTRRWSDQAGSIEFQSAVLPGWLVGAEHWW